MKMANMERLLFKGTVDEIDVGRLQEGMEAELKVGALPTDKITGALSKISLKAEKKENATVFPIEILGAEQQRCHAARRVLRECERHHPDERTACLMIPERVRHVPERLRLRDACPGREGKNEERLIKTGLSDAINDRGA